MATINNIFQALGYFGSNEAYFKMIDTVDDINCVEDDSSFNLLQLAISNGYYDAAEDLIKRGININYKNSAGWTALILSIFKQRPIEYTRLLLENGANPHIVDYRHNNNALWYAISMLLGDKCYYYDNVIELLKNGADLHNVNKYGHTPMEMIIELDDKDLLVAIEPYI